MEKTYSSSEKLPKFMFCLWKFHFLFYFLVTIIAARSIFNLISFDKTLKKHAQDNYTSGGESPASSLTRIRPWKTAFDGTHGV